MYTDEDIDYAVTKGIFTDASVAEFRALVSASKNAPSVDEENFKLIGGFNDIFVVIACLLLLFSSFWVLRAANEHLGLLFFVLLAWGLAEFFVLKRKMALPAIVLLLSFVGGVFALFLKLFPPVSETALAVATAMSAISAYCHWQRFKVPITIAAGFAAIVGFCVALLVLTFPGTRHWLAVVLFIFGFLAFFFAMYWDASDRGRVTYRSDVAFWLHLLSAPLIIHPVFSAIGVLERNENLSSMVVVIGLYLIITCISLAVDRRVFMVSSLIYVLYAISNLLKVYGAIGYSFALTGVFIGSALLLLSAFWHSARTSLVNLLPTFVQRSLPEVTATRTHSKA